MAIVDDAQRRWVSGYLDRHSTPAEMNRRMIRAYLQSPPDMEEFHRILGWFHDRGMMPGSCSRDDRISRFEREIDHQLDHLEQTAIELGISIDREELRNNALNRLHQQIADETARSIGEWFRRNLQTIEDNEHDIDNDESPYDPNMPGKTLDEYMASWDELIKELRSSD